jgi:hypothetical protein
MSGSSGSDFSVGGGIGGASDCAGIRNERELQNPDATATAGLTVGMILTVLLNDGSTPSISIVTAAGQVAGAIIPTGQLIQCLRLGVAFVAEVKSARGTSVILDIRAA